MTTDAYIQHLKEEVIRQERIPWDEESERLDLSANSLKVLAKRYLRRDLDGNIVESPAEMFRRVAYHIALPDEEWGGDVEATTEAFYGMLTTFRFMPNSPTFTGAGTPLGQLAACFVLPISDDMGKEPDGIFMTLRNAALIQQTGGGNGFSFSRLRPKGDRVSTSAGVATGPVGFMRVYDMAFEVISQGGVRRGANMAVLRVDHPDILEFVRSKEKEGELTNFNISVALTDEFMRAVEQDREFHLVNPRDGKVWHTVRARDLFDEIVRHAHHNGEPGALFIDTANRSNPVPHLYELEATNPCGEQWLGPYENCCLGSVNLAKHVKEVDGKRVVDWELLQQTVETAVHFLDNVVTANKYVPAVPQLKEAALRNRRIGLGIMGLADMMYDLGIRYGSEEAREFAAQVMEFVRYHAMRKSIELAKERGPFPAIKGSIYDPEDLKWRPPEWPDWLGGGPKSDWGRPPLDWEAIVAGIKQHGIRNAAQTTIAPTGTIATVSGCEGYGCEPVFALAYIRHFKDEDRDVELEYVSPRFMRALEEAELSDEAKRRVIDEVLRKGTCQHIEELPEHIRHTFVVAQDITAEEHVYMQAALQVFVDNSISKTVNFPEHATVDDVKTAYFLAWRLGCKGITVYVTGTRKEVVLETRETKEKKEGGVAVASAQVMGKVSVTPPPWNGGRQLRPRPTVLQGKTYRRPTPVGTAWITVNSDESGEPFEVFLNVGKAGSDVAADSEALGRLISLILRLPSPLSPRERLEEVIHQLSGIGGGRSMGFGPHRVRSLPDAIAQVLRNYLEGLDEAPREEQLPLFHTEWEEEHLYGDICPECGQATFVPHEGCKRCHNCGYSEC